MKPSLFISFILKVQLIIFLILLIINDLSSQTIDSFNLDEVEIIEFKSTDLALPDPSISANQISNLSSVEDYLSYYSDAFIKSYGQGGFATISLDGLQARHTQVFWNGLPVNTSTLGVSDISTYPIENDVAIATLKSAESYRFTGGQIGGAVVLENYYRSKTGFNISLKQGSFGYWNTSFQANKYIPKSKLKLKLNVGYSTTKNDFKYTDYTQNPTVTKQLSNAGYNKYHIQPGFEWSISNNHLWQFNVLYSSINRELPATVVSPNNSAHQQDDALRIASHWKFKQKKWQNSLIAGYVYDQLYYEDRSGGNLNSLSEYKVHKTVLNETASRKFKDNILKFGGNLLIDIANGTDIKSNVVVQAGLFALWKVNLFDNKLKLSSTIRGEFHSELNADGSGNISIISQPLGSKSLQFKISGHRNIRYPTINDLFFEPSGNAELNKESSWQYSGSVSSNNTKTVKDNLEINYNHNIEVYSIYLKDMIIWVPTNKIYWQPINLTKVHSRGLKLHNSFRILQSNKKFEFNFSQFYNLSVSTNEENIRNKEPLFPNDLSIGKQLPYIPKHQLKLNAYFEYQNAYIGINNQFTSERFITGSNSYFLQKYWMLDAIIGYNVYFREDKHIIKLSFALNNLSGNEYHQEIVHIPMPGRNYQISVKYNFEK